MKFVFVAMSIATEFGSSLGDFLGLLGVCLMQIGRIIMMLQLETARH
ncbi:hypothetical protein [Ruegeria arenilitoris]|nr:hypothetical protein [Ruegeria arenilitoris]